MNKSKPTYEELGWEKPQLHNRVVPTHDPSKDVQMEKKTDEGYHTSPEDRIKEQQGRIGELREENKALKKEVAHLQEENRRWMHIASTMDLTHLPNRILFLKAVLPTELKKAMRGNMPFSCIMLSPDNVGEINQTHGRQTGDRFIRSFADFLKKRLESKDRLFHLDGANFLIFYPSTDPNSVKRRALLLRQSISSEVFYLEAVPITTTVSLGIITFETSTTKDIVALVDRVYWRLADTLDKARGKGGDHIEADEKTRF